MFVLRITGENLSENYRQKVGGVYSHRRILNTRSL